MHDDDDDYSTLFQFDVSAADRRGVGREATASAQQITLNSASEPFFCPLPEVFLETPAENLILGFTSALRVSPSTPIILTPKMPVRAADGVPALPSEPLQAFFPLLEALAEFIRICMMPTICHVDDTIRNNNWSLNALR